MNQYAYSPEHRRPTRSLWDRTWKDRNGHLAVWQMPNRWLIGWAVGTTLSLFFGGIIGDLFFWIAAVSLVVWSLLEMFRGASYFRRLLGLVVLAYVIASMLKSL